MTSPSKFVMLFGVSGCITALSIAVLMTVWSANAYRSPSRAASKARVDDVAQYDATIISLRQQAVSALTSLQDASENHR